MLALPSAADLIKPLPDDVLGNLGDAGKRRFWMRLEMVERIIENPERFITRAYAREAQRVGLSADAVKKLYLDAMKHGARALVDHRLCGTRGCGLEECGNGSRKSRLPQVALDYWQTIAERNLSVQRTGERAGLWAWRQLMAEIHAGKEVPGLGDWRAIHRHIFGMSEPLPKACPWSEVSPPPGWSYQNFQAKPRNRIETAAMQRGMVAVNKKLPMVRTDWGKLRPMEVVFVDDKRLDFPVWFRDESGAVRVVELWALFAMDAATRRIVWCNLFPRYTRPDGTQAGIAYRDTQHLVAAILGAFGYPTAYKMQVVGENAAAAFSKGFIKTLPLLTGGQVSIRTTGLWNGRAHVGGFVERGGNPNGKGVLESFFNRLDITLGDLRGQLGGNYMLKPGSTPGRLAAAKGVAKALEGRDVSDEELGILLNLESLAGVRTVLLNKLAELEHRDDHELEGFEQVGLWRYGLTDPEWKPLLHPELLAMRESLGDTGLDAFLRGPGRSTWRMESPVERWSRLYDSSHFRAVSPSAFSEMWMDHCPAVYEGAGFVKVKTRGSSFQFVGTSHQAKPGQRVTVVFDAEHPTLCALRNEAGQFLGTMAFQGARNYHDQEALAEQLAAKEEARKALYDGLRNRQESPHALRVLVERTGDDITALSTIAARASLSAAADAGEEDVVDALTTRKKARKRKALSIAETHELLQADAAAQASANW